MKRPVKIIVVGGNAAGPAAAARAKRFNPNADVTLYEESEYISTGTCEIPYVISGEIDDYRKIIFFSPSSFQKEKGVEVYVKHTVEKIDTKKKQITIKNILEDKITNCDYDRLILATGSRAKVIPGFNTQLKNVFTLKNISDLNRIKDVISKERASKAIVIGAGYIGLEAVESLAKNNIRVHLIERESKPLPGSDEEFRDEILKTLHRNKIEFSSNAQDLEPVISDDRVLGVSLGKKIIETDLVIISVGFEPATYLATSAKIEIGKSGAIKIDNYARTSERYVYAAGDNVELINAVSGKAEYIPLATHAYELGQVAGENSAGGNVKYESFVKNISLKVFDKFFVTVGLSTAEAHKNGFAVIESFAKVKYLVSIMPGSDYLIVKVLADKNSMRIIGGSFLGGEEVSGYADLLSALIKLKTPASILSKLNYNYTPPLSPFINPLKIIGKKLSEKF